MAMWSGQWCGRLLQVKRPEGLGDSGGLARVQAISFWNSSACVARSLRRLSVLWINDSKVPRWPAPQLPTTATG